MARKGEKKKRQRSIFCPIEKRKKKREKWHSLFVPTMWTCLTDEK